jgi:hypothetical protein
MAKHPPAADLCPSTGDRMEHSGDDVGPALGHSEFLRVGVGIDGLMSPRALMPRRKSLRSAHG